MDPDFREIERDRDARLADEAGEASSAAPTSGDAWDLGNITVDPAAVTCPACLSVMAWRERIDPRGKR